MQLKCWSVSNFRAIHQTFVEFSICIKVVNWVKLLAALLMKPKRSYSLLNSSTYNWNVVSFFTLEERETDERTFNPCWNLVCSVVCSNKSVRSVQFLQLQITQQSTVARIQTVTNFTLACIQKKVLKFILVLLVAISGNLSCSCHTEHANACWISNSCSARWLIRWCQAALSSEVNCERIKKPKEGWCWRLPVSQQTRWAPSERTTTSTCSFKAHKCETYYESTCRQNIRDGNKSCFICSASLLVLFVSVCAC